MVRACSSADLRARKLERSPLATRPMLYLFRLGPIDVGGRASWLVAGVDGEGDLVSPQIDRAQSKALSALLKQHTGETFRCEPALAELAGSLGIAPAPLPRRVLEPRGVLAFALSGPLQGAMPDRTVVRAFLGACARFWAVRPWERLDSVAAIPVVLQSGGRRLRREAAVLGSGGEEYGLALYDEPGSIARVADAVDAGRMAEARHIAAVAVTFEAEPTWAAAAIEDAFGLPLLPIALRLKKGRVVSPTSRELAEVAAALEAVAMLLAEDAPSDADAAEVLVSAGEFQVKAEASLQREGLPELADPAEPMLMVEPASTLRRDRIPRNATCPCGSGRKYKRCHLAEDEARAATAHGQGPGAEEARATERRLVERDPVHNLDERITADALALGRRRWGRAFDPDAALATLGCDAQARQSVLGWSSGHYRSPDGRTALDLYVEERGSSLDEAARRLVQARASAWFSVHEVMGAIPGVSVALRDLLSGAERTVEEKSASQTLVARDVILAEVLDLGDRCILAGCHPTPLPPREGDLVRKSIRRALGARGAKVSAGKLRAATAQGLPLELWQAAVHAIGQRPPPRLQNTDGEDFLLTTDFFDVAAARRAEVLAGLHGLPGAQLDDAGGEGQLGEAVISFVQEGNAMGLLPSTLVGRAILGLRALRLETNSRKRADRLRRLVSERLGATVTFKVRQHADPVAALRTRKAGQPSAPLEPTPPELLEAMRRIQEEFHTRWLDVEVPALGGLTPREAARRGGAARRKIDLLLAEFENAEARRPAEERFDVAKLHQALGLAAATTPSR